MTNTNKTSNLEYCEKCGTMLMMGICRRCKPELTRTNKSGKVIKIYNKNTITSDSDVMKVHEIGVNYANKFLFDNGINSIITGDRSISLILDNGKTILVRAMSTDQRVPIGLNNLDDLKSDYLIIVANLKFNNNQIYILTIDEVKKIVINNPRRATGDNDYFINKLDYIKYQNNYNILIE